MGVALHQPNVTPTTDTPEPTQHLLSVLLGKRTGAAGFVKLELKFRAGLLAQNA